MFEYKTSVHGSIFYLLKKFVLHHFSEPTWNQLLVAAGKTPPYEFVITEAYPLEDINEIVEAASVLTGKTQHPPLI